MSGKGGGMGGGPGGLFNFNKSGAKKINKELVTTKFKDVAGMDWIHL
jgi:ATP-dependent Zn protease